MRFLKATLGHHRTPILFSVDCEIKKWEWVFLDGDSGSGKSTLLETIFGTLPPLAGSFIDHRGRDLYRLSGSEMRLYRRTCGMIFQDHKLMPTKTVMENIAYALEICGYSRKSIHDRTLQLLAQVGMLEKAHAFVDKISGWEAQRVAIARALIHEPDVILADEPTASLDHANTHMILEILEALNKRWTTIIFATHDHSLYPLVSDARIIDVEQWK